VFKVEELAVSNTGSRKLLGFVVIWLLLLGGGAVAYKIYVDTQDKTDPSKVPEGGLEVPFILWGGDVATFHANGGLKTQKGTIFDKQGLKLNLVRGDDFDQQVKNYLDGKSPFLRGTMSMLGQASEKVGKDPKAQPVVFLQLTWSAGDHMVGRANLRSLADLEGKKIALQEGGPHVGMLDDILRTAKLTWKSIKPVWTKDVSGKNGPAERFRNDTTIDACFVITPEMTSLTGGLDQKGTGIKGTVEGAHVVVSTATMSRSIADVYACRKDFYDANKEVVHKFAAGYLKACEELVELKKKGGEPYKAILKLTQEIFGKDDIQGEEDADGLISDAAFVGLPGNISFFTEKGNLNNFEAKQSAALDLAVALDNAKDRHPFLKPDLDYAKIKEIGSLTADPHASTAKIKENVVAPSGKENTLFSFDINFDEDQKTFDAEKYGKDFQRAAEQASLYGKALIVVRGHADLTKLLGEFVRAAMRSGLVKREGVPKNYKYFLSNGSPLALTDTAKVLDLIEKENLVGGGADPKASLEVLVTLSRERAEAVRDAVIKYAEAKGIRLDKGQIKAVAVGVREPVVAKPLGEEDAAKNRRVEFRIVKVGKESVTQEDFNY
jgi:ABC-type nitrate/sulfonate/bicarbonate transport system substrate-binding protein/outer membrane protein OmpA-like peptidoglycan-associated protein